MFMNYFCILIVYEPNLSIAQVYLSKAGLRLHQKSIHERPEAVPEPEQVEDVRGRGQRKAAQK